MCDVVQSSVHDDDRSVEQLTRMASVPCVGSEEWRPRSISLQRTRLTTNIHNDIRRHGGLNDTLYILLIALELLGFSTALILLHNGLCKQTTDQEFWLNYTRL